MCKKFLYISDDMHLCSLDTSLVCCKRNVRSNNEQHILAQSLPLGQWIPWVERDTPLWWRNTIYTLLQHRPCSVYELGTASVFPLSQKNKCQTYRQTSAHDAPTQNQPVSSCAGIYQLLASQFGCQGPSSLQCTESHVFTGAVCCHFSSPDHITLEDDTAGSVAVKM